MFDIQNSESLFGGNKLVQFGDVNELVSIDSLKLPSFVNVFSLETVHLVTLHSCGEHVVANQCGSPSGI